MKSKYFDAISKSVPVQSVKLSFRLMSGHFIAMIIINVLFAILPIAGVALSRDFYGQVQMVSAIGQTDMSLLVLTLLLYMLYLFIMKSYSIYYKRVRVQFSGLPTFEKKVKQMLHEKCSQVCMEQYETPSFFNTTWEAKVASINIYRIMECVVDFAAIGLSILLVGTYLSAIHPALWLLIMLSALPSLAERLMAASEHKRQKRIKAERMKRESEWYKCLTRPEYYKEIQCYHSEAFMIDKWEETAKQLVDTECEIDMVSIRLKSFFGLIKAVAEFGIFAVTTYFFSRGTIAFGEFVATLYAATLLQSQYTELFTGAGYFTQFILLAKPFFAFMNDNTGDEIDMQINDIALSQISYHYPTKETDALNDIRLSIKRGEKIVIVGHNGVGKSTLIKLIAGYLLPTNGSIVVNQNEMLNAEHHYTFNNVSVNYQDYCRYDMSLGENIAFSRNADMLRIEKLLNGVGLHKLIPQLGDHLGHIFGDSDLSGGQWQRVAIARCFYKNADFLLFDEPTSAIDPIEENRLNNMIFGERMEAAVVVASHRLSIAKLSDRVYVMQGGKIIESGTHQELMKRDTLYARMWEAQTQWYK